MAVFIQEDIIISIIIKRKIKWRGYFVYASQTQGMNPSVSNAKV